MTASKALADRPAIEELSAAALARELHCHVRKVKAALEAGEIPGAYRTDGGQWRCPRWAVMRWQAVRGGLDPAEVLR